MASNTPWIQSSRIPRWGQEAISSHPDDNESTELPVFYRYRSSQATVETTETAVVPFRGLMNEYRLPPGFFHLHSRPGQQQSGTRVMAVNNDRSRVLNPRNRQDFQQDSTPRIILQTSFQFPRFTGHFQLPTFEDAPRLTRSEQDEALKKLKKETYRPSGHKRFPKWSSLYQITKNEEKSTEKVVEDGKSCVICLEEFVPGEQVVVTPCKHMFHEDCVVPWVKSHGQCPVCRLAISNSSNNNGREIQGSLLRDTEEGFF